MSVVQHKSLNVAIRIYAAYRFFLALMFIALAVGQTTQLELWPLSSTLTIALLYFLFACGFLIRSLCSPHPLMSLTFIGILADILCIALLEYTDIRRGIPLDVILVVSIAAGGILFIGNLGSFIAIVATISLIIKEIVLRDIVVAGNDDYFRTALLGLTYLTTSWISQTLAIRIRDSEVMAMTQAANIQRLQHLNQAIVERMHTGVCVFRPDLSLEMMNKAAEQLLLDPEADAAPSQAERKHNTATEQGLALIQARLNDWLVDANQTSKLIQTQQNGPHIKLGFTFLQSESRIVAFLEDHAKIKQQAQQLKLASLGQIAASIAHEIRNPLAAISYATQLLHESNGLDESQKGLCEINLRHVARMNDIIGNVLQLARRETPHGAVFQLSTWLDKFLGEAFYSYHQMQRFEVDIDSTIEIYFDCSHLEQVLTNLIQNSFDALGRQTNHSSDQQVYVQALRHPHSNVIGLNIRDFGPGFSIEHHKAIFEPFFTTSADGSGLGLFLSRELCELNHASLHAVQVEQGACFQIMFKPRAS